MDTFVLKDNLGGYMTILRYLVSAPVIGMMTIASAHATDFSKLSITQTARMICQKQASSEEVIKYWLKQIDTKDQFNSFASIDESGALKKAKEQDLRLSHGEPCLPLGGIPFGIKDNIQVKGMPNTGGTPALSKFYPQNNAVIIDKLESQGAIIIGKTTMHELAFGTSGYNTSYKTKNGIGIKNSFDHTRIPGGSSSGSGAAIGAHLIPAALGTDTGGSVRIPCALNSCVGFRPSVGRYSTNGIIPISFSRDTAGPMANSVEDIALIDSAITNTALPKPINPQNITLGVPDYFWEGITSDVAGSANQAVEKLKHAGIKIVPVSMPGIGKLSNSVGMVVAIAEAKITLKKYLAEQNTGYTLETLAQHISSPDVKETINSMVIPGLITGKDGKKVSVETEYKHVVNNERLQLKSLYDNTFKKYKIDAIIFPTTTDVAMKSDATASTGSNFMKYIRNTDPGSNISSPGLTIPVKLGSKTHLPIGMAVDGLSGDDSKILAIGQTLESIWGARPNPI